MADLLSTAVSPWSYPTAWDTITIGKLSWYGKFEIRGASRKYKWNIADGWGFSGAYEIFQAQPPAKFTITFYVWADSQYSTYLSLLDALTYSPTHLPPNNASGAAGSTNALTLVHPQLQNNRISQAVVESIGGLEKQSDDLMFSFTVDFVEFVPQRAFPPQTPDTSADPNDPNLSPEVKAALAKAKVAQQEFDNAVSNVGTGPALP